MAEPVVLLSLVYIIMHFLGQTSWQVPQPMHFSPMMTRFMIPSR